MLQQLSSIAAGAMFRESGSVCEAAYYVFSKQMALACSL